MTRPDAAAVRGWSQVDLGGLGYGDDVGLQVLVDRAVAQIESITLRTLDASMPANLAPIAEMCAQFMTEKLAFMSQEDVAETEGDFGQIATFSAGSYSETRRNPKDLILAGAVDADPRINSFLWALMTDDARDTWISIVSGVNAPAFEVTEIDWSGALTMLHGTGPWW